MSPETFASYVRRYCEWAESSTHDLKTAHELLQALIAGAPGLRASIGQARERTPLGFPREVVWADTKRYADFPFQCYYPSHWQEVHPEGNITENIYEDFAHIYAELRHGLEEMEKDNTEGAIAYWCDSYFYQWGHHANAAVWAIEEHEKRIKNG